MDSSFFPLVFVSTAVPGVPKLSVLMQAVLCAHREHPGCTQTHQREEAQEKHHSEFQLVGALWERQGRIWGLNAFVVGISGEAGGERAVGFAAALRHPAEGRGRGRQRSRSAAGDLRGGL